MFWKSFGELNQLKIIVKRESNRLFALEIKLSWHCMDLYEQFDNTQINDYNNFFFAFCAVLKP